MGLMYLFRNMPVAVKNLLLLNLLFFVATFVARNVYEINLIWYLGMKYFGSPYFEPFQVFTHMFMHGGFSHILFNMFGLLMFGSVLERFMGTKKFLILYLVAGLSAAVSEQAYWAYNVYQQAGTLFPMNAVVDRSAVQLIERYLVTPMVGASGAVYGLLAAYAMFFPNSELMLIFFPFPIKAKYFVPGLMAIDLFLGVSSYNWDSIAHFAHLGGALAGFLLLKFWKN
jgi:membrane associated rhomboid family serine protease